MPNRIIRGFSRLGIWSAGLVGIAGLTATGMAVHFNNFGDDAIRHYRRSVTGRLRLLPRDRLGHCRLRPGLAAIRWACRQAAPAAPGVKFDLPMFFPFLIFGKIGLRYFRLSL
jgi:hypothetical protein